LVGRRHVVSLLNCIFSIQ